MAFGWWRKRISDLPNRFGTGWERFGTGLQYFARLYSLNLDSRHSNDFILRITANNPILVTFDGIETAKAKLWQL